MSRPDINAEIDRIVEILKPFSDEQRAEIIEDVCFNLGLNVEDVFTDQE